VSDFNQDITALLDHWSTASIRVQTMGIFRIWREEEAVSDKQWGRDKTLQLIQYLITARAQHSLHKERIMDRIWESVSEQDFKVALHGINKVLEPERQRRAEAKYISRQGSTYQLITHDIAIDAQVMESLIAIGNQVHKMDILCAQRAYREALALHQGVYLPNRVYEDWSSEERERLQILALGAYITLAESLIDDNPMEAIRLSQHALEIDNTWEDAYRIIITSFANKGNRPAAIKAYNQCVKILDEEYGIDPLPETRKLIETIKGR